MSKLIVSILTRNSSYKYAEFNKKYFNSLRINTEILVGTNTKSFYSGHQQNLKTIHLQENDIILMLHDDIKIISDRDSFVDYISLCKLHNIGFLCLAGCTYFDKPGLWWNARNIGASRGFVFQGLDEENMTPNMFGPHGQIVCGDGCFLACSYKTLKLVGLDQPEYLSSGWDFYDIHLTLKAHLMGLNNYTVPIICKHESAGNMRQDWYTARDQFLKHHYNNLPVRLNYDKTNGLPKL